jgi:uncharacterized membrane protein
VRTSRLEAFSDGVFAIIITIMVLELKAPHEMDFSALSPLTGIFLSYVLSFVFLGIYWNNHHHLLHAVRKISGGNLWANLHLLFWLSLIPFATAWMGENCFAAAPVALYGIVLLCAALAWIILQTSLIRCQEPGSILSKAVGKDIKGKTSIACYVIAIATAASGWPLVACALYIVVAIMWLVPDRRIERVLAERDGEVTE